MLSMKIRSLNDLFAKKKPIYRVIKLYSVNLDQNKIDRSGLVDALLAMFEKHFRAVPDSYDIGGPYGIKKGSTIGLKAFKNKLRNLGHEKYYALTGETDGLFGFTLLLEARLENITYSELIIWFSPESFDVDFQNLVQPIVVPFSVTTGFCIDIEKNFCLTTETRISHGLFGGRAVTVSYEHKKWLTTVSDGNVRDIFRHNIFNQAQARKLEAICTEGKKTIGDLAIFDFIDESALKEKREQLTSLKNA